MEIVLGLIILIACLPCAILSGICSYIVSSVFGTPFDVTFEVVFAIFLIPYLLAMIGKSHESKHATVSLGSSNPNPVYYWEAPHLWERYYEDEEYRKKRLRE